MAGARPVLIRPRVGRTHLEIARHVAGIREKSIVERWKLLLRQRRPKWLQRRLHPHRRKPLPLLHLRIRRPLLRVGLLPLQACALLGEQHGTRSDRHCVLRAGQQVLEGSHGCLLWVPSST